MGPKLQALLELQDIELQIVDIRRQLGRRERAVKRQEKKLAEVRASLAAEHDELKRMQVQVGEADLDLKARTGHIDRMRERLNTVKTNKEYAATLAELNNEKADVSKIESRALELMDKLEQQKTAYAEHEQAEQTEQSRLSDLQAQFEQSRGSFAAKLERLQKQRAGATESIDAEALKLFERLSERYEGESLAQIERTHPRRDEFVCGGCYMSLSAEMANAVLTRDEVTTCPNCGRILWMEKGG